MIVDRELKHSLGTGGMQENFTTSAVDACGACKQLFWYAPGNPPSGSRWRCKRSTGRTTNLYAAKAHEHHRTTTCSATWSNNKNVPGRGNPMCCASQQEVDHDRWLMRGRSSWGIFGSALRVCHPDVANGGQTEVVRGKPRLNRSWRLPKRFWERSKISRQSLNSMQTVLTLHNLCYLWSIHHVFLPFIITFGYFCLSPTHYDFLGC